MDAALVFQETRPKPSALLLAGGIGANGQRLRDTITASGLTTPARHYWNHGWIWHTGILWRGYRPVPPKKKPPRRRNQPTFRRFSSAGGPVEIEDWS
ncbi:hypothetical protein [Nocardia sp. NPDC047038]|uniref:hypothetical protein n=1 Tax=Nocardia sp. NPDC047038 TaxID=3154338 RepID=UPI0033DDCCF2